MVILVKIEPLIIHFDGTNFKKEYSKHVMDTYK